ncbi:MAG: hypothetical protein HFH68_11630 [Lachnospiraceae bacterium]|nr:hypothetical protein [Lachnospiraceae bacterium]
MWVKSILITSILYIYIPVFLFLYGFTKPYWALIVSICLVFCIYKLYKDYSNELCIEKSIKSKSQFQLWVMLLCILIIFIYGYYMGYGGFAPQKPDWGKHNAVLNDLVTHSWPVYYKNGNEKSMLVYYIAQYLVPALAGKVFNSFNVAETAQYIWNVFGIFLVFLNIVMFLHIYDSKKKIFAGLFIVLFFSGALWLAQEAAYFIYGDRLDCRGSLHWLTGNNFNIQLRSNMASLMWAFPQWIVPCLAGSMLFRFKNYIRHYVTLLMPLLLFASLSFLGVLPIAIIYAIYMQVKSRDIKHLKNILSTGNIVSFLSLGTVLLFYFYGNVFMEKPAEIALHTTNYGNEILAYFAFCFFMFGLHALLIRKKYKNDCLFYLVNLVLIILPLFSMGLWNDLVMGAGTVPMFLLMMYIIDFIFNSEKIKKHYRTRIGWLIVLLITGMVYPLSELKEVVEDDIIIKKQEDFNLGYTMETYANRELDVSLDLKYNYYSYDIQSNVFYKYIARKKL